MRRYPYLAVASLCIAASCGSPSTARPTAGSAGSTPDEPAPPGHDEPAPAASAPAPDPVLSGASAAEGPALAPDAAPELAPIDVRTADGVVAFVSRMCERARAGDAAWVQAHVALPLVGNVLVNENGGDPLLASSQDTSVASVAELGICREPPVPGSELRGLTVEPDRVTGAIKIGRFDHRLTFALAQAAEPRLEELSFVLPDVPMPRSPKKKAPRYDMHGRVKEATEGFGGVIEVSILQELKRRPACIQQHFVRNRVSGSLSMAVSKADGKEATVRVYASTVVPASLLGCLEKQLGKAIAKLFRGAPFYVDYHLILAMPIPEDEIGDDVPMIMSGE